MPEMSERLLDLAQEFIQTCGYNAFSYRDLAEATGITTASIHYHFRTKSDLGQAVVVRHRERLIAYLAHVVAASPTKTVLEIAEDNGIRIDYDCRSGICGQYKTKLVKGRVAMDTQDALDPIDRSNQIILSCQARCLDAVVVDA